jgi:spore coat protein A, manganese oxidase
MAERYEVVIDFSKYSIGTRLYLQNTGLKSKVNFDTSAKPLMCFDVVYDEPEDHEIPSQLRPFTTLSATDAQKERSFVYENKNGRWVIDNKVWNPQRIDSQIEPGAIEVWTFINPQNCFLGCCMDKVGCGKTRNNPDSKTHDRVLVPHQHWE